MSATLTSLPFELILQICSFLRPSSRTSLRFTCWVLHQAIATVKNDESIQVSICELIANRRIRLEHHLRKSGKRQCEICHAVHSLDFFRGQSAICKWHDGWLMSTTVPHFLGHSLKTSLERQLEYGGPVWIRIFRPYCMHCREIQGWHTQSCSCRCKSCGRLDVECYVRISSNDDRPICCRLDDRDEVVLVVEQHSSKVSLKSALRLPDGIEGHFTRTNTTTTVPALRYDSLLRAATLG